MSRSLVLARPPLLYPDDLDPPPASILVDPHGYIDDRTNATTAESVTRSGKRIRVTFWVVSPPRCSFFTVYSPDLERSAFGGIPMLLSTEDGLALLRVPICRLGGEGVAWNNDHFVYHAGDENNKPPSLYLIPRAPGGVFSDENVGLLRCRDGGDMYFIAILCWAYCEGKYELHLYSSKTDTWSCKMMYLASSEQKLLYTYPSKAVDLWRGILVCDVLKDSSELRYIPLPPPLVPRKLKGPPLYVRDIIVVEGYIKKDSWDEWKKDSVIEVPKYPAHTNPDQQEAETKTLPTLKGFYSGYPALSHHDSGVVYILDRHGLDDTDVTVLAVDMRKHTLKGVADCYSPRPLGYSSVYFGSGISKHLLSPR
ncbi:hypothetical protein SORBI_3001G186925 [Sorghum bicolor]|uniref:DUF1618 domain-containing protein n=1 Tax=Sorghum bicolor TaxID=4558 RepID=A0A1Z5S6W1_SORBI|nr:hypothetical protein SORBI_3001G186925 [Sorghum bicolor]